MTSPPPAWPGFREAVITAITRESDSAISLRLEDPTGAQLPAARPGQYLTLRVQSDKRQRAVLRNYSLSGPPGAGYYRVTVKHERGGAVSGYLRSQLAVGDQLDIAAPSGTFTLDQTDSPVLLISAGIGATPVLAMLQALAQERSEREIWWLQGARDGREHPFAAEARASYAMGNLYACKEVLVIGTGNSGPDIAQDLHASGATVTMCSGDRPQWSAVIHRCN